MTEVNSSVRSKVLKLLPKLKTEELEREDEVKNIDVFVCEKYDGSDYEKVAEHIYKTYDAFMKEDCFVASLKFIQEPELGEGDSPKNISQYPLEDILDKFGVVVQDFYEDLNDVSDEICYLEFSSPYIESIQKLLGIVNKHVYNKEDGDFVELVIE